VSIGPWYIYIIQTIGGKLYTGITKNIEKRFEQHLSGTGAKFFRTDPPEKIVWSQEAVDRSEASKIEIKLKKLTVQKKRELIEWKGSYDSWSSQGD